jgi:AraC-like DNA-binding protein
MHHGRILRQGTHKYIEILIPAEYFLNDKAYNSLFCDEKRAILFSPPLKERSVILSLAQRITEMIRDSYYDNDIHLFAELLELLKVCKIIYEKKENNNRNVPAILDNAIEFIRKEYAENIQISDIAKAVNCSQSYLSRIFKKHVGKSPYCYLTEYRLFVAEKLLRNGSAVTDTAVMSGFCDSSVFIKCFKKSFGITPLKYKKKHEL